MSVTSSYSSTSTVERVSTTFKTTSSAKESYTPIALLRGDGVLIDVKFEVHWLRPLPNHSVWIKGTIQQLEKGVKLNSPSNPTSPYSITLSLPSNQGIRWSAGLQKDEDPVVYSIKQRFLYTAGATSLATTYILYGHRATDTVRDFHLTNRDPFPTRPLEENYRKGRRGRLRYSYFLKDRRILPEREYRSRSGGSGWESKYEGLYNPRRKSLDAALNRSRFLTTYSPALSRTPLGSTTSSTMVQSSVVSTTTTSTAPPSALAKPLEAITQSPVPSPIQVNQSSSPTMAATSKALLETLEAGSVSTPSKAEAVASPTITSPTKSYSSPRSPLAADVSDAVKFGITNETNESIRTITLQAHNDVRKSNEAPVVEWSEDCARCAGLQVAVILANECVTQGNDVGMGQNCFLRSDAGLAPIQAVAEAVKEWALEKEKYQSGDSAEAAKNFTQLVWKATKSVGCAVGRKGDLVCVVCNYTPKGNQADAMETNVSVSTKRTKSGKKGKGKSKGWW